ncbi:MAG: BlaI/MecI/CopY family transcriptional regulator [Planctomycetota bacterium]|jgi:predicted transcriptional regulator
MQLTKAELAVMEVLWTHGPVTARFIREELYPQPEKAQHGTVQRLLTRLMDKGAVDRDASLAVHHFAPAMDRAAYGGRQLESLADQLTGGSIAPLLTHLLSTKKLDADEISRLRRLLDDSASETDRSSGVER